MSASSSLDVGAQGTATLDNCVQNARMDRGGGGGGDEYMADRCFGVIVRSCVPLPISLSIYLSIFARLSLSRSISLSADPSNMNEWMDRWREGLEGMDG